MILCDYNAHDSTIQVEKIMQKCGKQKIYNQNTIILCHNKKMNYLCSGLYMNLPM
jgi:hypothetical protein